MSNAVSTGINSVESSATSLTSTVSNAWNSLPPQDQAIAATVGIDAVAVAAGVATGGTIYATPLGGALAGTAISSSIYTVTSGSHATFGGVALSAASGAVAGALTMGVGELLSSGSEAAVDEGVASEAAPILGSARKVWQNISLVTGLTSALKLLKNMLHNPIFLSAGHE